MKNIKKFLLITAMTMALGTSAFAESGFEFILNVPLGAGIYMPSKTYKDAGIKGAAGFDAGVAVQLGYMAQVVNGFGISALVELGYAHDSIGYSSDMFGTKVSVTESFDSFQLGLLPKFNIGAFAIGIGGGVKVPLGGKYTMKVGDVKDSLKYAMGDALSRFTPPVIGYIKATFDYSIFFTDRLAFNIGLYLGGDIAKQEVGIGDVSATSTTSSFDIGVELGLKFGPRA